MASVKCPHCGAGNRHPKATDVCWQCGLGLWEPVDRNTYALSAIPARSHTTALKQPWRGARPVPLWKIRLALAAAILAAILFLAALAAFLSPDVPPEADQPPGAEQVH